MKTIHNINKWSFMITLLLYITIYFGLLAQIPLAFIQLIIAISITIHWKKLHPMPKKLISRYWLAVLSYVLVCVSKPDLKIIWLLLSTIIPMSIAGYFVYVTYTINKSHKGNNIKLSLNN